MIYAAKEKARILTKQSRRRAEIAEKQKRGEPLSKREQRGEVLSKNERNFLKRRK